MPKNTFRVSIDNLYYLTLAGTPVYLIFPKNKEVLLPYRMIEVVVEENYSDIEDGSRNFILRCDSAEDGGYVLYRPLNALRNNKFKLVPVVRRLMADILDDIKPLSSYSPTPRAPLLLEVAGYYRYGGMFRDNGTLPIEMDHYTFKKHADQLQEGALVEIQDMNGWRWLWQVKVTYTERACRIGYVTFQRHEA